MVLLLIGAFIRFIPAFNYQYSFDELSALSRTTYANWHDLILYGARIDAHPILIQCFLYAIIQLVGYSEFWIKLPFIIFSLAAAVYAYKISIKWFGKLPALISAAIYLFSFIFLFYSPLARMYASGLFFSTALLYYWLKVLMDETVNKKDVALMALFFLLCALNAHLSALFALTLGAAGLLHLKKDRILLYLGACLGAVLLYLPHLPITFFQLEYGGIGSAQNGWLPAPGKWAFAEFIRTALGTGYVWVGFAVLLMGSVLFYQKQILNRKSLLLITIFFVNYFVIYFYSVLKAPIFQFSVMLFSSPALVIGFSGLIKVKEKLILPVVAGVCVILLYQSLYVKDFFTSAVYNQNEFQYKVLKREAERNGANKVEAVFYDTEKYFLMHYELRDGKKQNYHMGYESEMIDIKLFRSFLKTSTADKIVLGNPLPSQLEMVKEFFPFMEEYSESANVSCYVFSKTKGSKTAGNSFESLGSSSLPNPGSFTYKYNHEKAITSERFSYQVDSLNEYPFAIEATLKEVAKRDGNILLARIEMESDSALKDASFNCVIKNEKDSTLYFGGPEITGFYSEKKVYSAYCELFVGAEFKNWVKQNSKLTFFIWNRGKNKFKIKSASVETLDFRPKRWSLWE